jgi:hypothetical protein
MKKNILFNPFIISAISFILASVISGTKFGIYNYLPSYHLFKLPNDISSGNIVYEFFRWNLFWFLIILIFKVMNSFNKKIGFDAIKELRKALKIKDHSVYYLILICSVVFPLSILLCDYINLSINFVNSKTGIVFPIAQGIVFSIWIIVFVFLQRSKK